MCTDALLILTCRAIDRGTLDAVQETTARASEHVSRAPQRYLSSLSPSGTSRTLRPTCPTIQARYWIRYVPEDDASEFWAAVG